jgi:hypothetical protein
MATLPEVEISPACPDCSGRGLARAVVIKGTERTITYECERCRHRWELASHAPFDYWRREARSSQ